MPKRRAATTLPLEHRPAMPRIGAYSVISKLARGGTAGVFLAEHAPTGRRVALKVLDPFYASRDEVVERMFAECAISRRARHPGLLAIELAERADDGTPYLVMELLDGENLGALSDREYVCMDAILAIGAQVAAAIAQLHAGGAIHCDLKPDNVMLVFDDIGGWPRVKVIDFGVSRVIADGPFDDTTIAGTPAYMAPEQWRGAPTPKSDVYALGCLLYELVVGEPPFHGPLPQLMVHHAQTLAARPSTLRGDLAPALDDLIMRALSKDEAMRPAMRDAAVALANLLDECAPARRSESQELVRISC